MKEIISCILICFGINSLSSQTTINDTIISSGIKRSYKLYIPAIYNSDNSLRPLIINMHGYTSSGSQQQSYTNFMPIADTANFLMVYPDGTFSPGTTNTYWNANFYSTGINDVLFLSSLIDTLTTHYRININRIYSTGFSNGGFMSHTLACELSNKIAAIASVSGTMADTQYGIDGNLCNPSRPIPIMQIHGDLDNTVPYNGGTNIGINMMAVDSVLNFWINHNNCNPTPTFSNVPNINTFDNCTATHSLYSGGTDGVTIELYKIISGGHTWPGSFPINFWEATNQDINASVEIWRFFNNYQLNITTNIYNQKNINNHFDIYPNPCSDFLQIDTEDNSTIAIINVLGEIIATYKINKNTKIDINHLNNGIYFIKDLANRKSIKFIKQ